MAPASSHDLTDKPVSFVVGAGGEIQHGIVVAAFIIIIVVVTVIAMFFARASLVAARESYCPETVGLDGIPVGVRQCSQEGTRVRMKSVDAAVTEVADEQCVTESAEIRWS